MLFRLAYALFWTVMFFCAVTLGGLWQDANAQLAPAQGQYYTERGVFKNPLWAEYKAGWTFGSYSVGDGCDYTLPQVNPPLKFNAMALKIDVTCDTSQSFNLSQSTDKFSGFDNYMLDQVAYLKLDGTGTSAKINLYQNGDLLNSYDIVADGTYRFYSFPFPNILVAGVSEQKLEVELVDWDGELEVKELNIKPSMLNGTVSAVLNAYDTDFIPYTPTFTGFGTVTGVDFSYKRVGDSIIISGRFQCGTTAGTQARISLPSGAVIKTGLNRVAKGSYFHGGGTTVGHGGAIFATGGEDYITFSTWFVFGSVSTDPLAEVNGSEVCATGYSLHVQSHPIPIKGWQTGRVDAIGQRQELNLATSNTFTVTLAGASATSVCSTPTCNKYYETVEGWTTTMTRTGIGTYTINLNPDLKLDHPLSCNANSVTTGFPIRVWDVTTTQVKVSHLNNATEGGSLDAAIVIRCNKVLSDFNKTINVAGSFKDTQIKKVEEQFPLTEQKLCDACYKGKALYKKCYEGSAPNGYVITDEATDHKGCEGHLNYTATRQLQLPLASGTSHSYCELIPSTGKLILTQNVTRNVSFCAEYTKD